MPFDRYITPVIVILAILVITWIATHPPKPPRPRPLCGDTIAAPSPIPRGPKAIIVLILLIATIAIIIRYAITHH